LDKLLNPPPLYAQTV